MFYTELTLLALIWSLFFSNKLSSLQSISPILVQIINWKLMMFSYSLWKIPI